MENTHIYVRKNARFTVICEGVVRMEYAEDGAFVNEETLFAKRSSFANAEFRLDGDTLTLATGAITLTYKGEEPFSSENLSAEIHTGGVRCLWHFGDKCRENLGGTLSTLDGVDGFRDLPDGLLSRDGWYVIDDSAKPLLNGGWLENRSEKHLCDVYLFAYGKDYKRALSDLAAVSGRMEMPRRYFLGSWYSRWYRYTADDFLTIIDEYNSHGFPIDILVMDMDWHYHDWGWTEGDPRANYGYGHAGGNLGWTGYTWNRRLIPDPRGLIGELHRRGVAVTLNDHPCDGVRDHEDVYGEFARLLTEAGYTEQVPDVPDKISQRERDSAGKGALNYRFNDGSRDYMDAFFKSTSLNMENMGVDFRWLDWQQDYIYPEVNSIKGQSHLQWLNYLYYQHSKRDGKRGMSFSRWGGFGDHKHPAYFSGDTVTNWDTLNFEIQMTVSAGNAGCFWWSHDIGGFLDNVPGGQGEVYVRWVQFGAFSAALRLHVCGEDIDRRPWTWGEPYCSAMRDMFRQRATLMPYIYSAAFESSENSIPLLRPLYLENPCCEEAYKHPSEYYFGSGFIAAPITKAGSGENYTVTDNIWLPEGQWYGWFDGVRRQSGFNEETNTLYTFPLFVRAGFPVVMQPCRAHMTSDPLDDMTVIIYCGEGDVCGEATLFEDDGVSDKYKEECCRKTKIRYSKSGNTHTISAIVEEGASGYEGEPSERRITVKLFDCQPVSMLDGAGSLDCYDEALRCAVVTIDKISPADSFEFTLK